MFHIYRYGLERNDKHKHNRGITEEPHVLKYGLNGFPEIRDLFHWHRCKWIAAPSRKYSLAMVWEFYASYAATIKKQMPAKAEKLDHPPLLTTLFRDIPVDLSGETI